MHAVGINFGDNGMLVLMHVLAPDSDSDFGTHILGIGYLKIKNGDFLVELARLHDRLEDREDEWVGC
jgi:hypothetical protein